MLAWIGQKVAGMAIGSISTITMYAGLAVTGLLALASVVFMIRKGGKDAVRVEQQRVRLESIARKRNIDNQIDKLDSTRLRERAARWQS